MPRRLPLHFYLVIAQSSLFRISFSTWSIMCLDFEQVAVDGVSDADGQVLTNGRNWNMRINQRLAIVLARLKFSP